MTPRELIEKVEKEDLSKDQLLDIAQKLGLDVDKRNGTASIKSAIIDKAEDLEAAFPDDDVYGESAPEAGSDGDGDAEDQGESESQTNGLNPPKDTSPQAADFERRQNAGDISGVEAPKQEGSFTPATEAEAAKASKAEMESESFQKPKGRVLVNTNNGRKFPWSAALANRPDMKEL